jgi:hypothetical protein
MHKHQYSGLQFLSINCKLEVNYVKNQYRIESSRASWWNHFGGGTYFITICTKNKEHFFGEIKNNKMELSHCGVLANVLWHEIKNHAKNVELGAFVVMPNHIHGILKLKPSNIVETGHALSLQYILIYCHLLWPNFFYAIGQNQNQ